MAFYVPRISYCLSSNRFQKDETIDLPRIPSKVSFSFTIYWKQKNHHRHWQMRAAGRSVDSIDRTKKWQTDMLQIVHRTETGKIAQCISENSKWIPWKCSFYKRDFIAERRNCLRNGYIGIMKGKLDNLKYIIVMYDMVVSRIA